MLQVLERVGIESSVVDPDKCIGCGACIEHCVFKARSIVRDKCAVDKEKCFGCGLCTTVCSTGAVRLIRARSH
ncbi:MAG: hypothetical protein DRO00_03910 [Thermoproteota archaeon]|nr:MAG: hypothetical protein DRO00_03910 [Candidatus Korarchaeota archaeon]